MPEFEIYQRKDSYAGQKRFGNTVTIQSRGQMSLSEGAFTALGSPQAVKYLIDKDEMLIGFQACKPREANSHAIRGKQHMMSAGPLLKFLGADLGESRRYDLQVEDGLPPYIDLKAPGQAVTSNRRKAVTGKS